MPHLHKELHERFGYGLIPKRPSEIAVLFDVNLPLGVQLKRAEKFLRNHQRGKQVVDKRNHADKYPSYLRLLDAEVSGANENEMAAELFSGISNQYPEYLGRKRVIGGLNAAKRLRDGDYLYLPLADS